MLSFVGPDKGEQNVESESEQRVEAPRETGVHPTEATKAVQEGRRGEVGLESEQDEDDGELDSGAEEVDGQQGLLGASSGHPLTCDLYEEGRSDRE